MDSAISKVSSRASIFSEDFFVMRGEMALFMSVPIVQYSAVFTGGI